MVVDVVVLVTLDVLGVVVAFILMEPDTNDFPACSLLDLILEGHELIIGDSCLDAQDILTEGGKRFLAFLTGLFGVEFLCTIDQGSDGLASTDHLILIDCSVGVGEMWIDVRRYLSFASIVLETVRFGSVNVSRTSILFRAFSHM